MRSMKFIQNYHNEHTKFNFGMLIVVILYEFHTLHFAVYKSANLFTLHYSYCYMIIAWILMHITIIKTALLYNYVLFF